MKTYHLSTTLTGVLSDDYLYFEGTLRPQVFHLLCDGGNRTTLTTEMRLEMEKYQNDLYNLFLRKFTSFMSTTKSSDEETLKLQALLQEIIKTRNLIENVG